MHGFIDFKLNIFNDYDQYNFNRLKSLLQSITDFSKKQLLLDFKR
jgi:hypothetical protein